MSRFFEGNREASRPCSGQARFAHSQEYGIGTHARLGYSVTHTPGVERSAAGELGSRQ